MWGYEEVMMLSQMCAQVNAFGTDKEDEFVVQRENGIEQGIFKTWAVPVIPFLDRGNLGVLFKVWPDTISLAKKIKFEEAIQVLENSSNKEKSQNAKIITETISEWQMRCRKQPSYLAITLERARLFSWLLDRRLTTVFLKEKLSVDLPERITRLVNRLLLAFGIMNPFYNLEAIVGNTSWLLGEKGFNSSSAGKLDAVAFLLPIAFREDVVATELNWNGLTWGGIHAITKKMLANPIQQKILLNVAKIAGVQPHHVVFAANALEWVPMRVGGKKGDPMSTDDALNELDKILSKPERQGKNVITIISNINALIRFLNWVPLIEDEKNFSGLSWTYASVCDTTNSLLEVLVHNPKVWQDNFSNVFTKKLNPQLSRLDASSAKGRFLLHLILNERRLKSDYCLGMDEEWREGVLNVVLDSHLDAKETPEPTKNIYPLSLVGGKPLGLSLVWLNMAESRVLDGIALSSNLIENFLRKSPNLWQLVLQLNQENDMLMKKAIAQKIERLILEQPIGEDLRQALESTIALFPDINLWAIRASSLNENEARGVYKTLLQVPRNSCLEAVKRCIASFYNRKAVFFRMTDGGGDLPLFAILLQPYRLDKGKSPPPSVILKKTAFLL